VLLLEELQGRGCRVEFLERPMSQDPNDPLLLLQMLCKGP
jgi:site-specific DNA recombinase